MPHVRKEDFTVSAADRAAAKALVERYHYSGTCVMQGTAYCHGLFRGDELVGAAVWKTSLPKSVCAALHPQHWRGVLQLSRLVVHPDIETNGASMLLGRSMKLVKRDARFCFLVTYADTWRGHTGAIYKATNWTYDGETAPSAVWQDESGRVGADRGASGYKSVSDMRAAGYTLAGRFSKHRFIYPLRCVDDAARS